MSKRKLPRRELPWIGPLLEKFPFSKLPTNHTVLQRLFLETELNNGASSLDAATVVVKDELVELWEYAGYEDILYDSSFIIKMIKSLTLSYKSLSKFPHSRRSTPFFLKKEADFLASLPQLFNITVADKRDSTKVTSEDRDFLKNHWMKKISSTPDLPLKKAVQKKLQRDEKRQSYYDQQTAGPSFTPATTPTPTSTPGTHSTASSPTPASSPTTIPTYAADFQPKRPCTTPRSSGTYLLLPRDILQKVGPTADRLGISNNQLTAITAVITNHGGGDIDDLSLSKSTARRSRASARKKEAEDIRSNFSLTFGQVNFDGKLLNDLYGFQKLNRLAVVVVQELENQILGIVITDNANGMYYVIST